MARTIDLDEPASLNSLGLADLERIVAAIRHLRELQEVDPELRATVVRRIAEAQATERITAEEAAKITAELDEVVPAVVLEARFDRLIPTRKALGAFPRRRPLEKAPDVDQWYRDDPRRLIAFVLEGGRFSRDELRILQGAADFADRVGIPDEVTEPVLREALLRLRESWQGDSRAG